MEMGPAARRIPRPPPLTPRHTFIPGVRRERPPAAAPRAPLARFEGAAAPEARKGGRKKKKGLKRRRAELRPD